MSVTVFVTGVFFYLRFVSFPGEGKIISPPEGNSLTFLPESTGRIKWTFDDDQDDLISRAWHFKSGDGSRRELLAVVYGKNKPDVTNSSLLGIAIETPATLVLKNLDFSYNGTYQFSFLAVGAIDSSEVTVYIAVKPTVTVCSSSITVSEGEPVTCLCAGQGGNPPATVTWYDKNGVQIGGIGKEENLIILRNVTKTDGGTYKCVAQSYTLKDEKSVEVFVYYSVPPAMISLTSTPEKATIGKTVVITCEAIAVPVPSYTIIHNNAEVVSTEKTHIINVVRYSHVGSYKCVANNKLGNSSKNYYLSVVATQTTNAPNTKIFATEKAAFHKSNDGTEWYIIVVTLVSGIIIGILLSYILVCSRRRFGNRKPKSNPQPETSQVDSIYQDLDLTKMNSEDNYQSLRVNSGRNEADYENQTDSTYTELNKVRDVGTTINR